MKNDNITAYRLLQEDPLPIYDSRGRLFVHESGAKVYHLANSDTENSFCFVFSTPVHDSKGVAHILEHSVLAGSEKFPLKEPFLELMKGSVNSFLNAITYPDKTIYPSASVVKADFFNLLDVYGDAVFFPLLRAETFAQEGHRLEFDKEGQLKRSGVVFNEMKGAYSSIDDFADDWAQRGLFEEHPYSYSSGGEPQEILKLSHKELVNFHRKHYRPSNCLVVLYGDIPYQETLGYLHKRFFSHFSAAASNPEQAPLMPKHSPLRLYKTLETAPETAEQHILTLSWLLPELKNSRTYYSFALLEDMLLSQDSSPLQDALLNSGLAESVYGNSGLNADLRQGVFICGLRGSKPENLDAFVKLTLDTLKKLAQEGIEENILKSSLQRVEFSQREIKGGFPQGLRLSSKIARAWFYGQNPFDALEFEQSFSWLKEQPSSYFGKLIEEHLLKNEHRCELCVSSTAPVSKAAQLPELSLSEKEQIKEENQRLKQLQENPDPADVLAKIKFLKKTDIPAAVKPLRIEHGATKLLNWSKHPIFSNGIVYEDLLFDLSHLPTKHLSSLSFFAKSLFEIGLPGETYQSVLKQLSLHSGRHSAGLNVHQATMHDSPQRFLQLQLAFLPHQAAQLHQLLTAIIRHGDWCDEKRIKSLLSIKLNELRESFIYQGSRFAMSRAASYLNPLSQVQELLSGISQLLYLEKEKNECQRVIETCLFLQKQLLNSSLFFKSIAAEESYQDGLAWAESLTKEHLEKMAATSVLLKEKKEGEGFMIPGQVGYLGLSVPGLDYLDPLAPAAAVLAHCLTMYYLWDKVRMQGGAYGAGATHNSLTQTFSFYSYRDPQIQHNEETFRLAFDFAHKELEVQQLDNAIVAIAGRELHPLSPQQEADAAFRFLQLGFEESARQEWRNRLLKVDLEQIHSVATLLAKRWSQRQLCALGPLSLLKEMSLQSIQPLPL